VVSSQHTSAAGLLIIATLYPLRVDRGCLTGMVNLAEQMARTGQGLAIYCNAGALGGRALDSFAPGYRSRKKLE